MNEILKKRYDVLGTTVAAALEKKGFEAYYCSTGKEAADKALSLMGSGDSIGYGGSLTVDALGIKEALRSRGNKIFDRDLVTDVEERNDIMHKALLADGFIMSANAISEDGQLVNIDGNGNRIAALIYGPKYVIVLAGMNKVVKTVEDAYQRARTVAAPGNSMRIPGDKKPCKTTGVCGNCNSPECICNQIVITRRCNPPKRIKVILIGEDLGL